jgi:DNA-binding transcriptional ArsR family regulator
LGDRENLERQNKDQLIDHIKNLEKKILSLEQTQLRERVKELNCLYQISRHFNKRDLSLKELIQGIIRIIPEGWQYPEITAVKILLYNSSFRTLNFKETEWKLRESLLSSGEIIGFIEVYYLEQRPPSDIGPFLKEEKAFLSAVAEALGRNLERIESENRIRESLRQKEFLIDRLKQMIEFSSKSFQDTIRLIEESALSSEKNAFIKSSVFNKDKISRIVEFLEVFASSDRFKIFDYLRKIPLSINDIKEIINKSLSTTSHHLQILLKTGILKGWKEEKVLFYSINQTTISEILSLWEDWMYCMPFPIKPIQPQQNYELNEEEQKSLLDYINAISNFDRFEILVNLQVENHNLTTLEALLEKPQTSIFHHLQILRDNQLVSGFSSGRFTDYQVQKDTIEVFNRLWTIWLSTITNWFK